MAVRGLWGGGRAVSVILEHVLRWALGAWALGAVRGARGRGNIDLYSKIFK